MSPEPPQYGSANLSDPRKYDLVVPADCAPLIPPEVLKLLPRKLKVHVPRRRLLEMAGSTSAAVRRLDEQLAAETDPDRVVKLLAVRAKMVDQVMRSQAAANALKRPPKRRLRSVQERS